MSSDASSNERIDQIESRLDRLEQVVADLRTAIENRGVPQQNPASPSSNPNASSSASTAPMSSPADDATGNDASLSDSINPRSDRSDLSGSASAETSSSQQRTASSVLSSLNLQSEDWLSYVGIGLLLFGLAFLFKYSIEQGWLVPAVRVGFGLLTGSVLLGAGLRLYESRRRLRQILLGGSSAAFYGTVFAAYQLYGLVSYPVAFGSMAAVTVGSIALALRQDHASMAVVGTIGGLGTPFLLYSDVGSVAGFSIYTCLVLGAACAIYLYRGWRSLLYTAVVGGWGVLMVPCVDAGLSGEQPGGAGVLQAGIAVAWLLLGGTPVLRAFLRAHRPDQWPQPQTPVVKWHRAVFGQRPAYDLVTTAPFVALLASRLLWTGSPLLWASVAIGGALLYAASYLHLRRVPLPRYAPAHGLVAAVLATYGLSEALGGATLLLAWAVEAVLLLVLARRLNETTLRVTGHLLFALVGGWLGLRLATVEPAARPLLSPAALSEGAVLALGVLGLRQTEHSSLRRLYRGSLIVGWFGWWANELLPLTHGSTYLLLISGASATGLLERARRGGDVLLRYAGHTVFGVLVGALAVRWSTADPTFPVVGLAPLIELATLGFALAASRSVEASWGRRAYRGFVLVGWLFWWWHELLPLPNGHAFVSLIWGLTATALLAAGAWGRNEWMQKAGLATLALFVGKLFFVDLATLPALWRIALFLGAGGGFLLVSYALPGLGRSD